MKKILIMILIVLLMLSFGCVKKEKDETGKPSGKSFTFTGKNGITADFEEDSPADVSFVYDPMEIKLELINRGAIGLAAGEIQAKLKGVAATEIFQPTSTEASNDEELLEAELDPTVTTIDLGEIAYSPEEMFAAEYKPKIEAEICFPYETQIESDNFWISDKQSDLDKGKLSSSDNSDAPLHVIDFEEFKAADKVRFQFTIENVGKGEVVDSCFPEEENEIVEVNVLQPRGANCETLGGGSGEVKLINGKKIIRCSVPVPKGESYATPLVIELSYNYDLELSKTITIKNIEGT